MSPCSGPPRRAPSVGAWASTNRPHAGSRHRRPGQLQESRPGRDVGDVGDPQLIWAVRAEVPLDEIWRRTSILGAPGPLHGATPPARSHDPGLLHEPAHTLLTDPLSTFLEVRVDAGSTINPSVLAPDRLNPLRELLISSRTSRRHAIQPGVVAAGGEIQHTAHRPHRKIGLIRLHEVEPRSGIELLSRANQAAVLMKWPAIPQKTCTPLNFLGIVW